MSMLRGVVVGAGYFSPFHLEAWSRIQDAEITAVADIDPAAAKSAADRHGIGRWFTDAAEMLDAQTPDFVDIITRPGSHRKLVQEAARRGIAIICQKPLAPAFAEAEEIVRIAESAGVPLMVHENFRFQPWYREIRRQINAGALGEQLHSISFRCRTGDGWQRDAYVDRQPYFREMPRLLIFETGIHFVDTFRYLFGEIESVFATLRKLNREMAGEDAGIVLFQFASGATGLWEGNRFNEPVARDARLTFGEAVVDGSGGTIRLDGTGHLTFQALGQPAVPIDYDFTRHGFAGDCVLATQQHFITRLREGVPFETSGREYLKSMAAVEAIYESAETGMPVSGLAEGHSCE